jgi:hypothetical protein
LVSNFVKRTWFVILTAIAAIAVFGSFVMVMLWSLLVGPADILFPVKVAIPVAYCALVLHALRGLKDRDIAGLIFTAIGIMTIIATMFGRQEIVGIYQKPTYLYIGESLNYGVKIVGFLAFILPFVFLVFSGLALPLAIKYGGLRRPGLSQHREVVALRLERPPPLEEIKAKLEKLAERDSVD